MLNQMMDSSDFALVVDAGGFSKGYGRSAQLQTEFLLKGMSMLNYDCVNLATKDFSEGGEFLRIMGNKYNINLLSSNIVYAESNTHFTEPFYIKKIAARRSNSQPPFRKLTIGFLGLCDERAQLLHRGTEEAQLRSTDPIEAAKNVLPSLKKSADIVVLFYNGRYNTLEALLSQVDGVDIVILGGEYYRAEHYTGNDVIVASTPSLGKYFGTLTIELDKSKKIMSFHKNRIPLDESIADDPKLAKLVADFNSANQNLASSAHPAER
ncbi:hypothetical protein EH223_18975 [candidate division KSB1 bacterium]|nr:hypothetical protein [candidate division KSB1 bacterium]RQW00383.1 MAG: hypothetical protein EH223_18975 [candidate division KSB1 bacterium]